MIKHGSMAVKGLDWMSKGAAFPSISTGVYAFPVELAANIAVKTVNRFVEENLDSLDVVIWVLFDERTEKVYEKEVDKLYYKWRLHYGNSKPKTEADILNEGLAR